MSKLFKKIYIARKEKWKVQNKKKAMALYCLQTFLSDYQILSRGVGLEQNVVNKNSFNVANDDTMFAENSMNFKN